MRFPILSLSLIAVALLGEIQRFLIRRALLIRGIFRGIRLRFSAGNGAKPADRSADYCASHAIGRPFSSTMTAKF
jgi:hypothetical protein